MNDFFFCVPIFPYDHARRNDFQSGGEADFGSQKWHISAYQNQPDRAGHLAYATQEVSAGDVSPSEVGPFLKM